MTIIVYQDEKLYTDTTVYTDYSSELPMQKWSYAGNFVTLFAGTMESITHFMWPAEVPKPAVIEMAAVQMSKTGAVRYMENDQAFLEVMIRDKMQPVFFGNNALCTVAKNYLNSKYSWDKPLMIEMVEAGIFQAVVEISVTDGLHYFHDMNGSSCLNLNPALQ